MMCLDHRSHLGLGGFHLLLFTTLGSLVAEKVIWRCLPSFDDEDALRRQRGEDCQGVHVCGDPDETEEKKKYSLIVLM